MCLGRGWHGIEIWVPPCPDRMVFKFEYPASKGWHWDLVPLSLEMLVLKFQYHFHSIARHWNFSTYYLRLIGRCWNSNTSRRWHWNLGITSPQEVGIENWVPSPLDRSVLKFQYHFPSRDRYWNFLPQEAGTEIYNHLTQVGIEILIPSCLERLVLKFQYHPLNRQISVPSLSRVWQWNFNTTSAQVGIEISVPSPSMGRYWNFNTILVILALKFQYHVHSAWYWNFSTIPPR